MQFNIITNNKEWDEAVNQLENASIYHTSAWKSLLERHGSKGFLVVAEDNGSVAGILPLFITKSKVFSLTQFYSIHGCGHEGPIIKTNPKKTLDTLLNGCIELARKTHSSRTVMNTNLFLNCAANVTPCYKYMFKNENYTVDYAWKNILPGRGRREVSRAIKSGLTASVMKNPSFFKEYYDMFSDLSRRRKLTIMFTEEFFKSVFKILKRNLIVFVIRHQDKIVGASIFFKYSNAIYGWNQVSSTEALQYRPNDLQYWEAIRYAIENNYSIVDYEAHPIGLLMGLHLMKDKYSTHRETIYIMEVNHNRKALLEDMAFYLGKGLKDFITPNFD